MQSTRGDQRTAEFIGADITDRYSNACRPIDVCGLWPKSPTGFLASFWTWEWDQPQVGALVIDGIFSEIDACGLAMLDGPQGLALPGARMRQCERLLGAAGKTPDEPPQPRAFPFAGYILSSLELFSALCPDLNLLISSTNRSGKTGEVYPGQLWKDLTARALPGDRALPKKSCRAGWAIRKAILEAIGISFDETCVVGNHDQLDACVSAVVAAADRNRIEGLGTYRVGTPVHQDEDGNLREGEIVGLRWEDGAELCNSLVEKLKVGPVLETSRIRRPVRSPQPPVQDRLVENEYATRLLAWLKNTAPEGSRRRAFQALLWLVEQAGEGNNDPVLLTCAAAWRLIYRTEHPVGRGANAFKPLTSLAAETAQALLPNLGPVSLDTFIVNAAKKFPGPGHWKTANYEKEEWQRVFGTSILIRPNDVEIE